MKNVTKEKKNKTMSLVLAKDVTIEQSYAIPQNANVLVIGASGAGKSRSVVSPNVLNAEESMLISDPKGSLYKRYGKYLENKGYVVQVVDFTCPARSSHYNFFPFIHSEQDVLRVARALAGEVKSKLEPYWEEMATMVLSTLIAYIWEQRRPGDQNFGELIDLVSLCFKVEGKASTFDEYMQRVARTDPESFTYRQYCKIAGTPAKTMNSIVSTIESKIGGFDTAAIRDMLSTNEIDFSYLGQRKTALFVIVSDTDRSMDKIASVFFTQALQELVYFADNFCSNERLDMPVRIFLDDFATSLRIPDFERSIASIRSRNISVMLAIQAESQLYASYGESGGTIIGNCDTVMYLGCNDLESAKNAAIKANRPLDKILNMPVGYAWLFRRGEKPRYVELCNLDECERNAGYVAPRKKRVVPKVPPKFNFPEMFELDDDELPFK